MVSIRDLLALKKAEQVCFPLFGLALLLSVHELLPQGSFIASWLEYQILLVIFFFGFVALAAIIAFAVHCVLSDIDEGRLFPFLGLGFMGFGLQLLGGLMGYKPVVQVNPLWYLWAIAYGFMLLEPLATKTSTSGE